MAGRCADRLILAAVCLLALGACHRGGDRSGERYLHDRAFRRATLVAALVNPDNAYSKLRLARYASGDAADWDHLPVWNPRVAPVRPGDLAAPSRTVVLGPPVVDDPDPDQVPDAASLRALGERAFFTYPAQLAAPTRLVGGATARYGLWVDDQRGVGGLVYAQMADGTPRIELTCATCHADQVGGRLVAGAPNGHVDLGKMTADVGALAGVPAEAAESFRAWGPGRADVTTTGGQVPERMADLRPIRWASHLHYDATLRQQSLIALAIRIETLIITAKSSTLRPPRIITLALAAYLWSLGDTLPPLPADGQPGALLFAEHCSECHAGPDLGGGPVTLAMVGTDPLLGQSPDRGTGAYRVPSLRGVSARPTLLHDGTVASLDELLNPARLTPTYTRGARGLGAVPGHSFGVHIGEADKRALLSYLRQL